jgi:hypothetical protein
VNRVIDVARLMDLRKQHPSRPSWSLLMMKAFGLVAQAQPALRRALLSFPLMRLYEHPESICALALERVYRGEEGIFVGLFRSPESQSLRQLQEGLNFYKETPIEAIGFYRQAIRISHVPTVLRRFLWWSTLEISGGKRAKRFGTFGLSSYGALGAESLHPISPLTTTVTYGPISPDGRVNVKFIYDHRVLDGAFVARRLQDLEDVLNHQIAMELANPELATECGADQAFHPAA